MNLDRRRFLFHAGLAVAGGAVAPAIADEKRKTAKATPPDYSDWAAVRREFDLSPDFLHFGLFFLTSHPRPVREAIERYRRQLDRDPLQTVEHALFDANAPNATERVRRVAADYLGGKPSQVALTGNTTTALALVYHGIPLRGDQEIVTTVHDHYSHHEAVRLAAERAGASTRRLALFDRFDAISEEAIVERIRKAIRPNTRAVGVTWVHSSSGVKLPIRRIAEAVGDANRGRDEKDRVLLVVDGVHGLGVEDVDVAKMGCDFFCSGTHKWILAPRGTGIIWAPETNWALVRPTIPSFYAFDLFTAWMENSRPKGPPRAEWTSPGGFHAFEHQWAVADAFEFHRRIGRKRVAERIHALNGEIKEGLAKMSHVELHTPRGSNLSAGIVCFDVNGMKPEDVVAKLAAKKILATTTPYATTYARVAAGLANAPGEIEILLREIRNLASA